MTFPDQSLIGMLQNGHYFQVIGILLATFVGCIFAVKLADILAEWRKPYWEAEFRGLMAQDEANNKRKGKKCCGK